MSEPEKKKRKTRKRNLRINPEAPRVRRNSSTTAKIQQTGFKQPCYLCVRKKRSTLIDIAKDKDKATKAIEKNGLYNIYLFVSKQLNKHIRLGHPDAQMLSENEWRLKNGVNITGRYININDQNVPICGTCYNRNVAKNPQFKALHPRVGGTKKKRKRKKRKYRRKSSKKTKRKRKTRKKN